MYEEIIINGKTMELDANSKGVQMVLQSPYLTDIKAIISNRTNTVTFPATPHNKAIIGCTSLQQDSTFAYRKHRAIYKRDGVQMFDGKATLLSVTDKNIQMCFTWGNTDAFQKLFDTNLRELSLGRSRYPATLLSNPNNYMTFIKYGGGRDGVGVSAKKVLEAIETKCGVTGLQSLATVKGDSKFVMALTSRNGDTTTRNAQRLRFGDAYPPVNGKKQFASGNKKALLFGPAAATKVDVHNYFDDDSKWFYTNGETKVKIVYDADIYFKYDSYSAFALEDVELDMIFSEEGSITADTRKEKIADAKLVDSGSYGETGPYWRLYRVNANVTKTFDVNGATYIGLRLCTFPQATIFVDAFIDSDNGSVTTIDITFDPDEGEDVIYGQTALGDIYPIGLNMPDMSCGQFIKNLLWLRGEFAFSQDGRTFEFASFNALKTNKSKAKDWTDKMITLQPKERQTTLDGTARKNHFRYAEADWYDRDQYSGSIKIDDETIQAETEYCKSDFALAPDNKIPVWSKNEDDTWDFAGNDIPPVLLVGSDVTLLINWLVIGAGYSSMQRWPSILSRFYQQYADAIEHPVIIKADFLITTADLNALDMRIPVYLKQTGRYYAIRKLTTKNAKVAEAELIELK